MIHRMRFTYQNGAKPLAGYTIQRGIHRGGFGEVYFAQSDAGKEVALKLLHHDEREIEIRGVSHCLNLKHPNLVSLYDVKTDSMGDHWVVMEYVSGSSLEDVLVSFPNGLPPQEVRDWLKGLVAGVAHLHDRGIVHRDLKPANVYRENGVVKIGDVGLSKRIESDRQRLQTQSVGTVYYMAPEVAKGQYGPEVDIYSLGVMLYELITGKLPFQGETTAEILMKHLTAQPDLSPIPKSLRPVLARALEKDPAKRTPTARQLEREFVNACESSEPLEIPASSFIPVAKVSSSIESPEPYPTARDDRNHWLSGTDQPSANQNDKINTRLECRCPKSWRPIHVVIGMLLGFVFIAGMARKVGSTMPPAPLRMLVILGIAGVTASGALAVGIMARRQWGSSRSLPAGNCPVHGASTPVTASMRSTKATPPPLVRRSSLPSAPTVDIFDLAKRGANAAMLGTAVSFALYLAMTVLQKRDIAPSSEHAALFGATTVIASWLLMACQAGFDRWQWTKRQRWRARIVAGLLCGTCAFAMDRFLIVDTPQVAFTSHSLISSVGSQPLVVAGTEATWLGYTLFFAALFGIRRWSRETDPYRKHQFQAYLVITSVVAGFLMSLIFAFPQWYAMLWAGTISTTIQLASNYGQSGKRLRTGGER